MPVGGGLLRLSRWLCGAGVVVAAGACLITTPGFLEPRDTGGSATTATTGTTGTTETSGTAGTSGATGGGGSAGSGMTESTGATTTTGCVAFEDWWDPDWEYRRRLVFDNTQQTSVVQDLPVLVVLDAAGFDYAHAEDDGADVRFLDADGSTALSYHLERWDPSGRSYAWVRVPSIDAGSGIDHVWLYYGSDGAPDAQASVETYDADFAAVWHLEESSGPHRDVAASLSCTWLPGGGGTQDAVGAIAGAVRFDGTNDIIECGDNKIAPSDASTITAWVRAPLTGRMNQDLVGVESLTDPYPGISLYLRASDGAIGRWWGNGYVYSSDPGTRLAAEEWTFLAIRARRDASNGRVQVSKNAGPWETIIAGDTSTNLQILSDAPLTLGRWGGSGPSAAARVTLDEVQISGVERSDDWVRATFLTSSEAFVTLEDEQARCQ